MLVLDDDVAEVRHFKKSLSANLYCVAEISRLNDNHNGATPDLCARE